MSASPDERYVTVARILRARGNKGEVGAELLTDFPDRLSQIKRLSLLSEAGSRIGVGLRSFWLDRNHPGRAVFHFEHVDSISEAEKLRGLLVQLPFAQRVTLPAGSYFVTDLIGCAVFELPALYRSHRPLNSSPCSLSEAPVLLGKVGDVFFPGEGQPGTPLLAVDTPQGELLVPLAQDICKEISTTARRIEVQLPEGLRDLNP